MEEKFKLAVDCRMIGTGGIGTYFESVLPYLLETFDCFLFGDLEKIQKYEAKVHNILSCNVKNFSTAELFNFPKNILSEINNCDAYYSAYCNVPKGIKIPVFTTIHDVVFLDVKGLASTTGTLIRKWFYQHAVNKSKAVFTVSQFSSERIKKHLNMKSKPLVVTYNSVPEWFLNNVDKNIKKTDTILFVGNIKKHKGLHTLLDAYKQCIYKSLSAKLLIVGNSENFRSGDTTIAKKLNDFPKDTVEFTGRVTDDQLKVLYQQARLFVQPSLYEGFGMPPMEALSLNTNVILSNIPVFKEIYKDMPVTYFEVENSVDLAQKIMENYDKPAPKKFENRYSFKNTSEIIINTIINSIKENM